MSQENAEIVRQPLTVAPSSRRRLEERAGLRFPGIRALLLQSAWRLPLRSRLRQALLRRVVQAGLEAVNRADFEVAFAVYDSEVKLIPIRGSQPRLRARLSRPRGAHSLPRTLDRGVGRLPVRARRTRRPRRRSPVRIGAHRR